jgi:predicted component of type VI protein secretion system
LCGDGTQEAEALLRVVLGPVGGETYESLMPGGQDYADLGRLATRLFAGTLDVELEVRVAGEDAPTCVLAASRGNRLGVDARCAADKKAPVRVRVRLLQDTSAARRVFV